MNKIVLLDRDGVINQDSLHYIKSVDEFIILPESLTAIARLTQAGYLVGIATNQSGVSRGYYSEQELIAIHNKLFELVEKAGGRIDALVYCIHLPTEECLCRKPKPGMLLALQKHFGCPSLADIPFIGDRISDIEGAFAAGAKPMIVLSPMTDRVALEAYPQVPVFSSLKHCVDHLLVSQ